MFNTWFRIKRLIRDLSPPMAAPFAEKWQKRLRIMYIIFAWNALGGIMYMTMTGRGNLKKYYGLETDEDRLTPGQKWLIMLKEPSAKIIRFNKFGSIISESEYKNPNFKDDEDNEDENCE